MAYELEDDHEDDLPDDLPTYEELACNHEWMEALEDEPFPEPEPVRSYQPPEPEPTKRESWTGTAIVSFVLLVVIAWLGASILHQQYNAGYSNGSTDGAIASYQAGASQAYQSGIDEGEQKALIGLQEWQYKHNCTVDTQGFVLLKMSRDNDSHYQFECVVESKK